MPTTRTSSNNSSFLSPNYISKASLDKKTCSSDSRQPSETAEWLLPDYRPTEYRSRSSSIESRSRSTSGSWDTHQVSAAERQWRRDQEAKRRNMVKKLFSYGFMEGK